MPRTTIDIDASVLRELKRRGRAEKKSVGQLVSEIVAAAMAGSDQLRAAPPLDWFSKPMGARVDLDDKDALWALLQPRDPG